MKKYEKEASGITVEDMYPYLVKHPIILLFGTEIKGLLERVKKLEDVIE